MTDSRLRSLVLLLAVLAGPQSGCDAPVAAGSDPAPAQAMDGGSSGWTVERAAVTADDGTELGGWVIRPESRRPVPTVLIVSPYIGQCLPSSTLGDGPCWPLPETPEDWRRYPEPIEFLVGQGYAVAMFSWRGTGASGGCFDWLQMDGDGRAVVDWLAQQAWSNHRVGTMGMSAAAYTAFRTAAEAPPALKTVVVAGVYNDVFHFLTTRQGLRIGTGVGADTGWGIGQYNVDVSFLPPGLPLSGPSFPSDQPTGYPDLVAESLAREPARFCQGVLMPEEALEADTLLGVDRRPEFWEAISINAKDYDRFAASFLITNGLFEPYPQHGIQEDVMWEEMGPRIEKGMWIGQWEHEYPWVNADAYLPNWVQREDLKDAWLGTLKSWLDYYLKDDRHGPRPDILGRVRFEDSSGITHESTQWPPLAAPDQVLHLSADHRLVEGSAVAEDTVRFLDSPAVTLDGNGSLAGSVLCQPADNSTEPTGHLFVGDAVTSRTVLAGNPVTFLDLGSDMPWGQVVVDLFDLGPDFSCEGVLQTQAGAWKKISQGGADLNYWETGYYYRDFVDGRVRIDLANLAYVLEPGHRIGLLVSRGHPELYQSGARPVPHIEIGLGPDGSVLQLPVLRETR